MWKRVRDDQSRSRLSHGLIMQTKVSKNGLIFNGFLFSLKKMFCAFMLLLNHLALSIFWKKFIKQFCFGNNCNTGFMMVYAEYLLDFLKKLCITCVTQVKL